MKVFITIVAALLFRVAGCEKDALLVDNSGIRGKLIYNNCGTVVVQVLDAKHHHLAQNEWKQAANKPTYENVFAVKNRCSFPAMEIGTEFTFEVIDVDPKENDCVVCAMWDNPPAKTQRIKVIK